MRRTAYTTAALIAAAALTCCGPPAPVDAAAKVIKCCPMDTILRIDMAACTGIVAGDQNQRETYETPDEGESDKDSDTEYTLSLANSSAVPWWVSYNLEFLTADNLSRTFEPDGRWFDGGWRIPCGLDDREMTAIDDDVAVLDDGRLIVFTQGRRGEGSAAGLDVADDGGWLTFSSAEYCVDRVSLLDNITRPDAAAARDPPGGNKDDGGGGGGNGNRTTTTTTTASTQQVDGAQPAMTYAYVALVCRPCSRITCVPKCCGKGFALEYRKNKVIGCRKTQPVATGGADAEVRLRSANGTLLHRKEYYFFGMKPPNCGTGNWYVMNDSVGFGLLPDGRMQVNGGLVPIERDQYCADAMNVVPAAAGKPLQHVQPTYTDVLLACRLDTNRPQQPLQFREILYGVYFVVGTAFLAATLLIYATLPELRVTVHSGNLIAHTVCLFVSYATLAATTLARHAFNRTACVAAGFVIQFSFLAAFFWLNVMCADIAWTFSGFRLLLYSNKIENEKKKYIIYSIYAWGCSVAITLTTSVFEFSDLFRSSVYKPNMGNATCWFSGKLSAGVFFYLPIALLMLTNFALFLFTAFRIVVIRRDTSKVLNRQINQNNMRLSLYLKLFCLMGVTFVFEVISWLADTAPPYYWYATDAINSLRGVFVFFIFCWKRSVLHLLLARAPRWARERLVRALGLHQPYRYPSFSSSCHHRQQPFGGSSTRTNATATTAAAANPFGGSFQLSQFGSSASVQTATTTASQFGSFTTTATADNPPQPPT